MKPLQYKAQTRLKSGLRSRQPARLQRQQGGTLLGLIIGLVVGLAIAVAVALLITKSSTPFTNKGNNKADMPTSQLQTIRRGWRSVVSCGR